MPGPLVRAKSGLDYVAENPVLRTADSRRAAVFPRVVAVGDSWKLPEEPRG
jgi:hypothetical protein